MGSGGHGGSDTLFCVLISNKSPSIDPMRKDNLLAAPKAGTLSPAVTPQATSFPLLTAFLASLTANSALAASTNVATAVFPLLPTLLSHVSGSDVNSSAAALSPPLFLFLPALLVTGAVTLRPVLAPSNSTLSTRAPPPTCSANKLRMCVSVASMGRLTRKTSRGVLSVAILGAFGRR